MRFIQEDDFGLSNCFVIFSQEVSFRQGKRACPMGEHDRRRLHEPLRTGREEKH